MLSLAGVKPPELHAGTARSWASTTRPRGRYNYGFRGRMDERYDLVRSVRDQRYIYIRNYMPHKIYGQYIDYMFQTPTTRVWKKTVRRRQTERGANASSGRPSRPRNCTTWRRIATR